MASNENGLYLRSLGLHFVGTRPPLVQWQVVQRSFHLRSPFWASRHRRGRRESRATCGAELWGSGGPCCENVIVPSPAYKAWGQPPVSQEFYNRLFILLRLLLHFLLRLWFHFAKGQLHMMPPPWGGGCFTWRPLSPVRGSGGGL